MGAQKKPANLSLSASLLDEARGLGPNVSAAAEEDLRRAVAARWRAENAEALASSNAWVTEHGLPLGRHRPL